MSWKVIVIGGPAAGAEYPIQDGKTLVVGRGSASDTQIADPKISRIHCTLTIVGEIVHLADSGRASGTFVRGKRVTTNPLQSGDEVILGDTQLRVASSNPLDEKTMVGAGLRNGRMSKFSQIDSLVGQSLNRFTIERMVSKGKNGVVFQGMDQADGKSVAIKVLNPQNAVDERQQERFIRAMRTMMPIRHPHIVRIYRAGRQSGLCWVAMEWVDGASLREIIDLIGIQGTLDWKDLWRIAIHIGRALCEAEKSKIVHRNVTPTNILRRNQDKSYLLTDLMFAKAIEETDAAMLTRPGDVIGELQYLAPERIAQPTLADCRTDQYSLGVTLYVLATGRSPFPSQDISALLHQMAVGRPEPPANLAIGFDERFSDLIMRLISKEPNARYLTAADLLKDLSRVGKFGGLDADWSEWI